MRRKEGPSGGSSSSAASSIACDTDRPERRQEAIVETACASWSCTAAARRAALRLRVRIGTATTIPIPATPPGTPATRPPETPATIDVATTRTNVGIVRRKRGTSDVGRPMRTSRSLRRTTETAIHARIDAAAASPATRNDKVTAPGHQRPARGPAGRAPLLDRGAPRRGVARRPCTGTHRGARPWAGSRTSRRRPDRPRHRARRP